VDYVLRRWCSSQPRPRGKVYVGDAGVRLRRGPDTTVGIDLVYLAPALAAQTPPGTKIIEVVPTLAVEILSPSDKQEEVEEKIDAYLERGIPQVWTVNPRRRTVTVFRSNQKPYMLNDDQELTGDPELPGFKVAVLSFFEDTDP
jgi:Uma2 family endonuclease